jgi:hypothetical protein
MSRIIIGLFVLLLSAAPVWAVPDQAQAKPAKETKAQKLRKQMQQPIVNFDKGIDANTPLKDAIEYLASTYDIEILIDSKAFDAIGVQKVEEMGVQLPRMVNASMNLVLRKLLSQISSETGTATFLIQGDHIEITTTRHADPRQWAGERTLPPLVDADFDRVCLDEAIQELADRTGINIVIDARVMEKARKPVTARFSNARLDTALFVLADMADLQAVPMDNLLYVTSKENAKSIVADQQKAEAEAVKRKKELLELRKEENLLVVPK